MTKYTVGVTMLTNRIYAGRVVKGGDMSDIRTDVTEEAICCVAEHLFCNKRRLGMDSVDIEICGKKYRLTVTEITEEVDG